MTSTAVESGAHSHTFQAHHFDSMEQQFQAGKLGMWLFLATEVLFFSGMFCAYAVYRVTHPEVFRDAAHYLNTYLGAANTIVLLASSLSVAWAVRCAQLNQQKGLLANLIFTVACAGIFMGVKTVEYTLKFHEGLLIRSAFVPQVPGQHPDLSVAHGQLQTTGFVILIAGMALLAAGFLLGAKNVFPRWLCLSLGAFVAAVGGGCLVGNVYTAWDAEHSATHSTAEHATVADDHAGHKQASYADEGEHALEEPVVAAAVLAAVEQEYAYGGQGPKFEGIFFSIYYAMTGVHAIHILCGVGVFVWIICRAGAGHFSSEYYGPVEYTALYWHLVDLIWIYLFPLLYLIR